MCYVHTYKITTKKVLDFYIPTSEERDLDGRWGCLGVFFCNFLTCLCPPSFKNRGLHRNLLKLMDRTCLFAPSLPVGQGSKGGKPSQEALRE